ncbi:MAG: Sugar transferase [Bacteroidetes bacterium]|nr:Sugar transferase [Bacteroidota bacterium]
MKVLAPICLFVYNRPWHTTQTIESLKKNILASESDLYIFSDGSRNDNASNSVNEVRSYIATITGFKSVNIILRETNLGLAQNIISGVSDVINIHGKIIVLEDDIITHPKFLKFMNDALDLYKNDENVASIHGYVYPIEGLPETFFVKGADCWGWATWARAWSVFEPNGAKLLDEIKQKKAEKEINYNNSMNYVRMLKNQIAGNNDSWAVRWHISAFFVR